MSDNQDGFRGIEIYHEFLAVEDAYFFEQVRRANESMRSKLKTDEEKERFDKIMMGGTGGTLNEEESGEKLK